MMAELCSVQALNRPMFRRDELGRLGARAELEVKVRVDFRSSCHPVMSPVRVTMAVTCTVERDYTGPS